MDGSVDRQDWARPSVATGVTGGLAMQAGALVA
jgi:hypothetical protein